MLDHLRTLVGLFPEALAAGLLVASACALLGVFVILKRVVFIGIALSEVAACGVAAAMLMHVHPFIGASVLTLAAVALLARPFEHARIPRDAVLGVVFVLAAAVSVLLVAQSGFGLQEVKALLYGDLILTSPGDLALLTVTLVPVAAYILLFLRPTVYTFLDRDAARVLGIRVAVWELAFFFALGLAVSAASKVAGALLVFCYLVVAPSAALLLARRLGPVLVAAVVMAIASTLVGLYWSVSCDLPTNPSIAVACSGGFVLAACGHGVRRLVGRFARRR
jgi:ABC-type Mn2+/Zn2+ transport system permease subunit